jgi:hypothetical protein
MQSVSYRRIGGYLLLQSDELLGMAKSDRELRQYRRMDDRLRGFLDGSVRIDKAISDLEGLLYALEETPEEWRRSFQEEWGTHEVFYALALEAEDPTLPDASVPELRQAAERMLAMVGAEIDPDTR